MNDYKTLDFDIVKKNIAQNTPINEAKERIYSEQIDFNPLIINRKLNETKEFLEYLNNGNSISFDGINSPIDLLNKAKKNIALTSNEILDFYIFHHHAKRIKKIINDDKNLNLIKEYSDSININSNISEVIESIIDANGNVKNSATEELANINKEINDNFESINSFCMKFTKNNSEYLQETNVCERNNRFVFLFKNTYKNKFDGYDYGFSGSGQASYIEPSALVILNNKRNELDDRKNKEINKILVSLTNLISNLADVYINNFDIIINISIVYSKASFGHLNEGCIAKIGDKLYLKNIKHPLIDKDKVIANTYSLENDKNGIIISGSNTGGKTVSLKVIGLSICMTYLGVPLIADEAIVPLYDKILVDVDNNQSLKDSLSTFSAHLSSINEIISQSTSNSIVLIDELVSGTDPKEAEAISLSLIEKLLDIGSKIIVTTHYGLVKKYAFDRNDLLLSSVEFDEKTYIPTYRYIENSYGDSNAFEIANRFLNDKGIVARARKILDENKTNEEKAYSKFINQMKEIESLKSVLNERINEYSIKKEDLKNKIKKFDESIIERKNEIITNFNNELDEIKNNIRDILKNNKNDSNLLNITNNIKNIDLIKVGNNDYVYKVGDRVRVNDIGNPGFIISIKDDDVIVDINGISVNTTINSLSILPNTTKKQAYEEKRYYESPSEIVLVGKRAEDALNLLDEFLDKARLANLKKVKVIHGIGTLALKNAIWDFLMKYNYADKYYSADFYDGGLAATIVELK